MLLETASPDVHASSGVLRAGARQSLGPMISPKDRNKLSINFLSDEPPRAETITSSRRPSSPLSHRARGVNRLASLLERSEDVQVASEISSDQPRTYRLEIVQHPDRTAEFANSALTRLPLAPPLIAQLVMRDPSGRTVIDESELPFLVAQLSLLSGDGSSSMDYSTDSRGQVSRERLLYGNLVSSPHLLRNLQGRRGVYFIFPDVGVRQRGRFQLKVALMRLPRFDDPEALVRGASGTVLAEARSLPFDVYPLRDYVAPAQTPLTQYFLQQGARMIASPPRSL
ncbi:velvet factor-domain-containing protein [Trametes punicea]|nr:velvet factor-domain-containing protein [Trametes punicea]